MLLDTPPQPLRQVEHDVAGVTGHGTRFRKDGVAYQCYIAWIRA